MNRNERKKWHVENRKPPSRNLNSSRHCTCKSWLAAFTPMRKAVAKMGHTRGCPCYEAGLVNDKKASHRRPRAFFKARGVRSLFPPNAPAASGAGSGGANPRLVCSACELGGVGVTLGLGDVLRQNSQDL
jgi:hypothetical protein